MIPVEEARSILLQHAGKPEAETVPLEEAPGRILAREIRADRDIPPFDRAAVDGYAVRIERPAPEGGEFPLLGAVQAGDVYKKTLKPNTAVKVMTGAPVPRGADAVIMVESSQLVAPDRVRLFGPLEPRVSPRDRPGIAPRGREAARGALLLGRGERLTPSRIAILSGVGVVRVPVYRQPEVSVLTTGREVVDPADRPEAGQIRDSNGPLLRSLLARAGFSIGGGGHLALDAPQPLRRAIHRLQRSEVLVLTGGVSAGDFDFVPAALEAEGYRLCLHKVAMRPGKPVLFGTRGKGAERRAVFGLPGNPLSVLVTAGEFLLPYLRARSGVRPAGPVYYPATAESAIRRRPGLAHFVLGRARFHTDGRLIAREVPSQGSGDYVSAGRANCLIFLPAGDPVVLEGGGIRIRPLDTFEDGWTEGE